MRDGAQRATQAGPDGAAGRSTARDTRDDEARIFACLDNGDRRGAEISLYRTFAAGVLARCVQMLRDQASAEDVAQQVVLEACRDLPRFQRRASLRTWLYRIAKNRCLDAIKARRAASKHVESEGDDMVDAPDGGGGPDAALEDVRQRVALEECLQELPTAMAETVRLRFQNDDLSYEEMAVVLNASAGTLNQRVIRALPLLEECLARKGWARG